jgi:DNA-binding LacI/PurR family transcriptional regulator
MLAQTWWSVKRYVTGHFEYPFSLTQTMRHRRPADPKRPTLYDVAQLLGLSQQTVSRVINNHPRVLPETRERVRQAIDTLGYKPNQAARFLANRRSTLIGLVTDDPGVYGPAHAILSLEQEARLHGYTLMIFGLRSLTIADAKAGAEQLIANSAEGLIVDVPVEIDKRELAAELGGIPFVTLDIDGGELFPSFRVDHMRGSRLATRHLISLGHTRIAGLLGHQPYRSSKLRRKGWLAEIQAAGLEPGPAMHTPWTPEGGYDATKELIKTAAGKFTAIFAANDLIAMGALLALREAGIEVPTEVSVVGFDNMPEGRFFHPPLTTATSDFDVMARESLDILFARIHGTPGAALRRVFRPELLIRKSTARARSA